jgi:hypothetical protein
MKNHFLLLCCDENSQRKVLFLRRTISRANVRAETLHGNDVRLGSKSSSIRAATIPDTPAGLDREAYKLRQQPAP